MDTNGRMLPTDEPFFSGGLNKHQAILVGGLEHFLFSPIVGMMIQSDYIWLIFFNGVETTN